MLTSSLRSRMADSSIPSAPSVRVLDGWRYLLSPLDHPLGCQRAWLAGWTSHADVLPPWQTVSSLLVASSVRASVGIAGGMDASYLPSSFSSYILYPLPSSVYPLLLWGSVPLLLWGSVLGSVLSVFYRRAKKGGTFVRKAFHSCGFSRRVLRKLQHLFAEDFVVVGYGIVAEIWFLFKFFDIFLVFICFADLFLLTFYFFVNCFAAIMASVVVTVCFCEMLRDVCQKYSLPSPRYGIPVGSDGLISVYVEVEIPRGYSVAQTVRIWGSPFLDADQSEEDAARLAVAKLRDEYAFEVKDANLEDKKFYENLYARLSVDHTVVCEKYKRLKTDYNLLKGYYNDLMSEKELLIAERRELIGNIEKCSEVFRRPSIHAVRPASSGEGSSEDPATPSGYRD
uniref:Uncharacterized protein n=1 Tax=Ananas comosus var. bracteatus TaxID=296719 RepID=A0A6V7QK83_ANACO|nr:unnamed protein product [Ananas comosus var. bracteatus]